jgi:hypothetical protein
MTEDTSEISTVVRRRFLRLDAVFHGIVSGVFCGLAIFVATNWLVIKGGPVVGPHLTLLGQFFLGYRVTFVGSLIGFGYAFVVGFVGGFAVAWVYNRLLDLRVGGRSA